MNDDWNTVPKWRTFQNCKARRPTWIKVYTELNSRDDWLGLSCGQRGLLVTTWLEYARANTHLTSKNLRRLCSKGDARYFRQHLEALNHAGFLHFHASEELVDLTRDLNDREPNALEYIRGMTHRYGDNRQ